MSQLEDVDLNLWSFIKSTKATELASLKSLQKFVLLLNKEQLSHLIQCYLQSRLSKSNSFKSNGLTMKQTADQFFNHEPTKNPLPPIDKQIISKLNSKYKLKYHKKVLAKTTQQKSDNQRHLLSIPTHVLAYSFQFLSFKELCKAQSVCVHFVYLNKQYPALTHYYFKMNVRFRQKAMRSRVLLSNLSFFKHIFITAVYCCNADAWTAGKNRQRRSQLFQYILKTIIQQSKSSLDTLDINIYDADNVINSALNKPEFNVLLYIMKEFDQLSISKLIWDRDYFKPSTNCTMSQMLQQIQTQFVITFPKLTSFIISPKWKFVSSGPTGAALAVSARHIPATLKQYILAPLIHDVASSLESMEIPYQNIGVIPLIAEHMINLKTLTISAAYETTHSPVIDISGLGMIKHIMLKKMTVDLWMWSNMKNRGRDVTNNLRYLFSTFIGITEFEYDFDYMSHGIDWDDVLSTVIEGKRMYSMNKEHDALPPLESLQFKRSGYEEGIRIMKSILHLQYCDLKHIGMEFTSGGSSENIGVFSKYFVSFLRLYRSKNANLS
eukprot:914527_1